MHYLVHYPGLLLSEQCKIDGVDRLSGVASLGLPVLCLMRTSTGRHRAWNDWNDGKFPQPQLRILALRAKAQPGTASLVLFLFLAILLAPIGRAECKRMPSLTNGPKANIRNIMKIEALCVAPPEARTHSPSQMPLSCPVAPQAARYDAGLITSNPSAFAHSDTRRTPLRTADRAPPRPRPPHLLA